MSENLPLRLMNGIHYLVLNAPQSSLHSCYYPANGEKRCARKTWPLFLELVQSRGGELAERLTFPPQTNDVQRSASLLIGYLGVAEMFQKPMQVREFGASGGLNLLWDKFHYHIGEREWGAPASPVHLKAAYEGPGFNVDLVPQVKDRRGCDSRPRNVFNKTDCAQLVSNIWPTQTLRRENFENALKIAREEKVQVDRASAAPWLRHQLETRKAGCVMVVCHSAVWGYIGAQEQDEINFQLERAGQQACLDMPLARLSLEFPPDSRFEELRLTTWPGGQERLLASVNTRSQSIRGFKR